MNISQEGIGKIRERISDWTPDNDTIRDGLNAATEPNPIPQGTVPPTVYSLNIFGYLSPASLARVKANTALPQIHDAITSGNKPAMLEWVQFAAGCGDISVPEAMAISAYILTPVPDPAWRAQLPWSLVNLGRLADSEDVHDARPEVH